MSRQGCHLIGCAFALVLASAPGVAAAQQAVANGAAPLVAEPDPAGPAPAPVPVSIEEAPTLAPADRAAAPEAPALPAIERTPLGVAGSRADQLPTPESPGGGDWILSTLASLGLVIALILLLRWGWGRMGGGTIARNTPAVEVLSRTSVAPRSHVLLVRVGGRILVVGDSVGGLRTLADVDDPDEVANLLESVTAAKPTSMSRSFSQLLSASDAGFDDAPGAGAARGVDGPGVSQARDSVSGLLARVRSLSEKGGGR